MFVKWWAESVTRSFPLVEFLLCEWHAADRHFWTDASIFISVLEIILTIKVFFVIFKWDHTLSYTQDKHSQIRLFWIEIVNTVDELKERIIILDAL